MKTYIAFALLFVLGLAWVSWRNNVEFPNYCHDAFDAYVCE